MHVRSFFSVLAVLGAAVATPCKPASSCNKDACLTDLWSRRLVAEADCSANLHPAASPTVSVVYETITITSTFAGLSSVTATATIFVEQTDIVSVVETDVVDYTATAVESHIQTVTQNVVVTVTASTDLIGAKRGVAIELPSYAPGCTIDSQYISACSCLGVLPATAAAAASVSTSYVTAIATQSVDAIITTVQTVPLTVTTSTVTITEIFSTEIVSQPVATVLDVVTYSTETIVSTSTETITPDIPDTKFTLIAIGSQDPRLSVSNGIGFAKLQSQVGSTTEYYFDFTADPSTDQVFSFQGAPTDFAPLKSYNGPGSSAGEGFYYDNENGLSSASYVHTASTAESSGGQVLCLIAPGTGYEYLQCKWGANQIAEFWTCNGHLYLVLPGYDFTNQCQGTSTSYKIPIIRVSRS